MRTSPNAVQQAAFFKMVSDTLDKMQVLESAVNVGYEFGIHADGVAYLTAKDALAQAAIIFTGDIWSEARVHEAMYDASITPRWEDVSTAAVCNRIVNN